MKLPKIDLVEPLYVPDGVTISFIKDGEKFILLTSALLQPKIEIGEKVTVSNSLWKFQRGNLLVEIEGDKEKSVRCEREECSKAWSVHYVLVDNQDIPILEFKNRFIFNGEEYSLFKRRLNISYLARGDEATVFVGGKIYTHEGVKAVGFTKAGLSIVSDGFTRLYQWDETFREIQVEGFILRYGKNEVLYTDLQNRIVSNGKVIGICGGQFDIISRGQGWILGSCNGIARYYFQGAWRDLETSIDTLRSDGSENFIGLVSQRKVLIYDQDLSLRYRFRESILGIGLRKAVIYTGSKLFKVDLVEGYSPGVVRSEDGVTITYPKGYDVKRSDRLISVERIFDKNSIVEKFEYFGGDKEEEVTIESEFISLPLKIQLSGPPIRIMFYGKIYVATGNGRVKLGEGNSILSGKVVLSRKSKVKLKLIISIGSKTRSLEIDSNQVDVFLPFELGSYNSDIIPVDFDLRVEDRNISKTQFIVPIIKVERPKTMRKIRANKGHVILHIDRYENGMFVWDNVKVAPTYTQPIRIHDLYSGELTHNELDNGTSFSVKENSIIEVKIKDPVGYPKVEIEGNYLCITPNVKFDSLIQIFYATHVYTGFRTKVLFPIDPVYNIIIFKIYIGNAVIEKSFTIDSLKLSLVTAVKSAMALSRITESVGLP
ncbi:hypothetical protein L3N51_00319 [Metallosphaera sp. J1]|uniref:protein UpsX n=1 Tax=Metallosphaera javensis (ex Hofmann et al. 2022) TaxID=99938 RepID=UPI001EDCFB2F|nr:hypothetical protein [Metallosphaera javensis (ex Hofmann et al. 2022)]MCG3108041.1 hypothetical protein [Metallosphaera javensis (ex Hofmann et al. 2022)]